MPALGPDQDAYGRALLDFHDGDRGWTPIIERDDGLVDSDSGVPSYFEQVWSRPDREAFRHVKGRVLDVGAGAGRTSLYFQNRGHDVVAIDNSPLAVRVLKARGVKDARAIPFKEIDARLGRFDSIAMWGGNFGLFGTAAGMRYMLRRLKKLTNPGARIVTQTIDPYHKPIPPEHSAYHRLNRERGRMSSEARMRVRYKTYRTPWFDFLHASPREVSNIVRGTGWFVGSVVHYPGWRPPVYFAILERED